MLDKLIDRIEPIWPPVWPSKVQKGVLQDIADFVAGSMTAQPSASRSSVLRVAAHGQEVAPLGAGTYPSTEVQSVYSIAPTDSASKDFIIKLYGKQFYYKVHCKWFIIKLRWELFYSRINCSWFYYKMN